MSEADKQLENHNPTEAIADDPSTPEVLPVNLTSEDTPVPTDVSSPSDNSETESVTETVSDAGESSISEALISQLNSQIQQQNEQYESVKGQYVRLAADFENFRKRTVKEKEDLEVQIKCTTLGELLSVVDNFERAREQLKPQTDAEMTIHKSYQSVYKQMVDALKKLGVSRMRPEGKEFDPNLHEAVLREPSSEHPEGTIIQELVGGYLIGDRVLRHAMVKVAAAMEPTSAVSNSETEAQTS
ncbi:nucleotide exchange factor GrpE [Merismopedia glauca]|uniref:Protein GrpE n=1 Tax=Merismopedia glauca CCAP 1448/3 TaxID=1296344 RepID=A0A2T1C076_9CYAN|nr:nucleotide exchange factor GrpE [Merismopedia glauca]PSB01568.1 nucleotide exchange factor GrpE [Merismopedia glauca CCAP 1448/3]